MREDVLKHLRESAKSMRENFPQITYVKTESVREKNPQILSKVNY